MERIPIHNSDKQLVIVNLHLEAYDDGEAKIAQTQELANVLKSEYEKGNYCIAGGDFNQFLPSVDEDRYPVINEEYFQAKVLDGSLLDLTGIFWLMILCPQPGFLISLMIRQIRQHSTICWTVL